MKNVIIIGAGGHGRVILDILLKIRERKKDEIEIVGFIDDNSLIKEVYGYKHLGGLDIIEIINKSHRNLYFLLGIGDNIIREQIYNEFHNIKYYTAIHPGTIISNGVNIGEGTVIMAGSIININTCIGKHCIINTGCNIDHDNIIKDFAHISPGCNFAGNVCVGKGTHIGIGTSIIPGVNVGEYSTVGAGSVVIKDIPSFCTAVGSPARPIKFHNKGDIK